ncbi:hypothetical protein NPIL_398591 [Nephila pilipes]|uniref:Uncharacterized protein n=1 Tax=Nephila pilipes TaxID=299642 RepID=A0A8X6MN40_NEPPI|nr:hypothetical protein NPIL_398591 [Nephila pilipes]
MGILSVEDNNRAQDILILHLPEKYFPTEFSALEKGSAKKMKLATSFYHRQRRQCFLSEIKADPPFGRSCKPRSQVHHVVARRKPQVKIDDVRCQSLDDEYEILCG